jgi:hypothetical protein
VISREESSLLLVGCVVCGDQSGDDDGRDGWCIHLSWQPWLVGEARPWVAESSLAGLRAYRFDLALEFGRMQRT